MHEVRNTCEEFKDFKNSRYTRGVLNTYAGVRTARANAFVAPWMGELPAFSRSLFLLPGGGIGIVDRELRANPPFRVLFAREAVMSPKWTFLSKRRWFI